MTTNVDAAVARIMQRQAEAAARLVVGARVMVRLNPECPAYPHHGEELSIYQEGYHALWSEGVTGVIENRTGPDGSVSMAVHTRHTVDSHRFHVVFDTHPDGYPGGRFTASELVPL